MISNELILNENIDRAIDIAKNLEEFVTQAKQENELLHISPELTGRVNIEVDYRSDFYSLGIIFFKLFTNEYPFDYDDEMQLVYAHIAIEAPAINSIDNSLPTSLSNIIEKLLSKNPDERYQTLNGIVYDLKLVMEDSKKEFKIASSDFVDVLKVSNNIYGRDEQTKIIVDTLLSNKKELIIIGGYSGIGKSSLINKITDEMQNSNIYFAHVKFEQQKSTQLFNAISQAMSRYIKSIVLEKNAVIEKLHDELIIGLGENIQLIIDFIPEVKLIVDEHYILSSLQPNEAQSRFNITLLKFINIVSSFWKKVVLVIDDMQWCDISTIKMIELILNDENIKNLSFVLTYRDNEVKNNHPFI